MRRELTIAILVIFVVMAATALAQEHSATITPLLNPSLFDKRQPFAGQVYFRQAGGYQQTATVVVDLTCLAAEADTQYFYLEKLDPYLMEISPAELVWPGPIDSGATLADTFSFTPQEVGRFGLVFSRKFGDWHQSLARLSLALNEDGEALYAGAADSCHFTGVKAHPKRDADTLVLSFKPRTLPDRSRPTQDFSALFKIAPAPGPGVTSTVNLQLECHEPYYKDVQFVMEHTTTLQPSALPESWGQDAGPNPNHRYFDGSFTIRCLAPGMGIFAFKVIGSQPAIKFGDSRATEFMVYYVVGYDGALKYIGTENPWERYSDRADPMLGSVTDLLDKKYDRHQFRTVRSLPDFIKENAESDSAAATDN